MILHGSRESGAIALTFDDGPDLGEICLVSALNEAGLKATFFWIPQKVGWFEGQHPDKLEQIVSLLKKGHHGIGVHGLTCRRPSAWERLLLEDSRSAVWGLAEIVVQLGYMPRLYRPHCVRLFRPPSRGMTTVFGSHFVGPKDDPIGYLRVIEKARQGDIICGHDSMNCDRNFGAAVEIARIIPEAAKILQYRGLKTATISEIVGATKS